MESTIQEIRAECDTIVALMIERDFVRAECRVSIASGRNDVSIILDWSGDCKFIRRPTLAVAFAEAREWIRDQPSAADRKRQAAIEATAKAAEAWREVGDANAEDAAAKAQIEALMKLLSQNILTKGEGV